MKLKFKNIVLYFALCMSLSLLFQECFIFRKNRCDSCPALVKKKKVRKATKGSI